MAASFNVRRAVVQQPDANVGKHLLQSAPHGRTEPIVVVSEHRVRRPNLQTVQRRDGRKPMPHFLVGPLALGQLYRYAACTTPTGPRAGSGLPGAEVRVRWRWPNEVPDLSIGSRSSKLAARVCDCLLVSGMPPRLRVESPPITLFVRGSPGARRRRQ